ncbi:hypothetical protein KCU81_g689, partial [Aureobasidium melanogenum]
MVIFALSTLASYLKFLRDHVFSRTRDNTNIMIHRTRVDTQCRSSGITSDVVRCNVDGCERTLLRQRRKDKCLLSIISFLSSKRLGHCDALAGSVSTISFSKGLDDHRRVPDSPLI